MYAKLINPKSHGKVSYNNTGSAARLMNYLAQEKGAQEKDVAFFGATADNLSKEEMGHLIDANVKGLRAEEAKFYSLVLSPSADELTHIGNSEQALKAYTREVMERYANNFQLKDGRVLESKDLVWGATIHQERHFRGTDPEVLAGNAKAGEKREGLQTHVHITVSARDAEQKITLNPGGRSSRFSLVRWQTEAGMQFQEQFGYTDKLQAYKKQQMRSKLRDAAADMRRAERIGERVEGLNKILPTKDQLDPARVQKIAEIRKFDKTFYRSLSRLENYAKEEKPLGNAYQLLATGAKGDSPRQAKDITFKKAATTLKALTSGMEQSQERTQDIGEKRGRRDIEM